MPVNGQFKEAKFFEGNSIAPYNKGPFHSMSTKFIGTRSEEITMKIHGIMLQESSVGM